MSTKVEIENNEVIDFEAKFRDMKSIDELDFSELHKMSKGKTPDDIQEKCLNLCKDYLSGNWTQQTVNTIEVRRITGGICNQLYYCGIKDPDQSEAVPQVVVFRFAPSKTSGISDNIITSLIFSEKNLGPKIYGVFSDGLIQKYYKVNFQMVLCFELYAISYMLIYNLVILIMFNYYK